MHTVSSSIRSKIPHFSVITPSLTLPPQSSDTNVITHPGDIPTRALTISRSQTTTSPTFYMTTSSVGEVGAGGPPIPNPFYPHKHCLPNTFDRYGDGSMCYKILLSVAVAWRRDVAASASDGGPTRGTIRDCLGLLVSLFSVQLSLMVRRSLLQR